MIGENIHHNGKGQHMAAHDEKIKDKLGNSQELPAISSKQELSCICHAVDLHVAAFEGPNRIACVGGDDANNEDSDHAPTEMKSATVSWRKVNVAGEEDTE
jgi:hypothetical protein